VFCPLAEKLTRSLKTKLRAARDAEILRGKDEGKSNREIARDVVVAEGTIRNIVGAQKENSSEVAHLGPPLVDKLAEIFSPGVNNWASALRALVSAGRKQWDRELR
jgi:predicted transcriptional regulator